jgi:quercetin dioxygenase-like cupin family protein
VQPLAHSARVDEARPGDVVTETPSSTVRLLDALAAPPPGADVVVTLHDGRRLAYAPKLPGPDAGAEVVPDPLLRGNAFLPVHESTRSLAALVSLAASRRLETGPESERVFVVARGPGLVFLENGDSFRFEPGSIVVVPPGEPAKVWAQGPDDALFVVLQPRATAEKRRTLAGEIAKRRAQGDVVS